MEPYQDLYQIIGYKFQNKNLLIEAITHPSVNRKNQPNYQRLEFLGDKILSFVIAANLTSYYPEDREGDLSKKQAGLVSGKTLSKIALEIGLDRIIELSRGEILTGGRTRVSNLENALEALIAGIYLDSNFDEVEKFILRFWQNKIISQQDIPTDSVSRLQEILQKKYQILPIYSIIQTGGNDHSPIFSAKIINLPENLQRNPLSEVMGTGSSKKNAQHNLAKLILQELSQINEQ